MGYPWPGMGTPLSRDDVPPLSRDGVPPLFTDWVAPPPPPPRGIGQQMEYLIRDRWYASCVHAGGLYLFYISYDFMKRQLYCCNVHSLLNFKLSTVSHFDDANQTINNRKPTGTFLSSWILYLRSDGGSPVTSRMESREFQKKNIKFTHSIVPKQIKRGKLRYCFCSNTIEM